MTIFNFLLALGMGAAISIYLPMISQSARILGAPVLGNVPFFAIAFLSSVVLVFVTGHKLPTMAKLAEVPAWLFIAGVVSALMIYLPDTPCLSFLRKQESTASLMNQWFPAFAGMTDKG